MSSKQVKGEINRQIIIGVTCELSCGPWPSTPMNCCTEVLYVFP